MPVRSFTDAEIFVSERRRLEQPLVVLVWAGVVLFSLAENTPNGLFFLIAGTVAAGIKLQAVSRGKELFLRRFLVNAGVLVATAGVVLGLAIRTGEPARDTEVVLGHYAILIQLCKLFERAKNRDYTQVLVLSLLTVMTACIFTDDLWLAIAVGAYLALACYTTMIFILKRGLDAAAEACLPTESGPLPADKVAWNVRRDWPAWPLRKKLVPILFIMAVVGALFFVVAPRTRLMGGTGPQAEKSSAVTGFADNVRLGDAKLIYLTDHLAMNVRLSTAPGEDLHLSGPLYLRGHVLEIYQNNQWSQRRGWRFDPCPPDKDLRPGRTPPWPGMLRMESNMLRSMPPVTLFGLHPARAVWVDSNLLQVSPSGEWRDLGPDDSEWLGYVIESSMVQDANFDEPPNPFGWERGIDKQVREEATRWCRDLLARREAQRSRPGDQSAALNQIDLAIAQRVSQRLASNYKYSLDLSKCDSNDDGVHDFLFKMKQGHCEYFASAMTVMCRALSVPARMATGFRLDEFGKPGAWQAVRDRDAHAWTEVWDRAHGWVVFDATPAGPPSAVERHWWSFLSQGWDDTDQLWKQRVTRFSAQDQAFLATRVRDWFRSVGEAISGFANGLWNGLKQLFLDGFVTEAFAGLVVVLGGAAVLAEGLVIFHLYWRKTQISRWVRRSTGQRWRQARFLARFLKLLARHGVDHGSQMTLLETARLASDQLGLAPDQAAAIVRLYYRLRWGDQDIGPAEIVAAEQTVENWARTLPRRKRANPATGMGE